jgi:hypothetical protein
MGRSRKGVWEVVFFLLLPVLTHRLSKASFRLPSEVLTSTTFFLFLPNSLHDSLVRSPFPPPVYSLVYIISILVFLITKSRSYLVPCCWSFSRDFEIHCTKSAQFLACQKIRLAKK